MANPGIETRPRALTRAGDHRLRVTAATLRAQVEPHTTRDVLHVVEASTKQLSTSGRQSLLQLLFAQ